MSRTALWAALATLGFAVFVMEVVVGHAVPVRVSLPDLPFEIAQWTGRTELIDEDYLRRARPDEFVVRRYVDAQGRDLVLYVGYYRRQASRGQVQAVCYGSCRILESSVEQIDGLVAAGKVNRVETEWNGFRTIVLYWYQRGDHISHDPYRGKLEQARRVFQSRRSDGALVRVAVPVVTTEYEARERGLAFARALLPALSRHLPD